jgi:hypothetical protein
MDEATDEMNRALVGNPHEFHRRDGGPFAKLLSIGDELFGGGEEVRLIVETDAMVAEEV